MSLYTVSLYACVCVQEFSAQAVLRLRPQLRGTACVVMAGEPPLQQVCALNQQARVAGATHGMTQVEMDTLRGIACLRRSVADETATRAALLECVGAFSPRVQECSSGGAFLCVADIAGTERLIGAPAELARKLLETVQRMGLVATVSVSQNFDAAMCLARDQSLRLHARVVPPGEESSALAPLSIAVLEMTPEQAQTFAQWGIRTLGELAALPETQLIMRMGQQGKRMRQLARGEMPRLFLAGEPAFLLAERMELDSPVELLEPLLFVLRVLLEQLALRAGARTLALASVTVRLKLEGGAEHIRTVKPAVPSNDCTLWLKLLHLDLQAHPPDAAVLSVAIDADPGSTAKVQMGLFSPQLPEPARLEVTLARIRAIVGEQRVGRAVLQDSHCPGAFRIEGFSVTNCRPRGTQSAVARASSVLRRLRPPEATCVTWREGQPQQFVFRNQRYQVEQAYGPWICSGDWWNPQLWLVEQWDLVARAEVADGDLLCCCVVKELPESQWQVMALYD